MELSFECRRVEEGGRMRLFLVEGSAIVRVRLIAMIADFFDVDLVGYADRADSAVELITALRPDVIILDLDLTAGSGLEVLREVRPLMPAAVVLVLTAYASNGYRQACQQLGADFFFDKSTEINKAIETLRTLQPEVGMRIWNSSAPW